MPSTFMILSTNPYPVEHVPIDLVIPLAVIFFQDHRLKFGPERIQHVPQKIILLFLSRTTGQLTELLTGESKSFPFTGESRSVLEGALWTLEGGFFYSCYPHKETAEQCNTKSAKFPLFLYLREGTFSLKKMWSELLAPHRILCSSWCGCIQMKLPHT